MQCTGPAKKQKKKRKSSTKSKKKKPLTKQQRAWGWRSESLAFRQPWRKHPLGEDYESTPEESSTSYELPVEIKNKNYTDDHGVVKSEVDEFILKFTQNCTLGQNVVTEVDPQDDSQDEEFLKRRAKISHITAFPIFGEDSIKCKKKYGTCSQKPSSTLRWGVDYQLAYEMTCRYFHNCEMHGYAFKKKNSFSYFLQHLKPGKAVEFYDSVHCKPVFRIPQGRSVLAFFEESRMLGWPAFTDKEVVWENVRVIINTYQGQSEFAVYTLEGVHLGHCNRVQDTWDDDAVWRNRYRINLSSIAGIKGGSYTKKMDNESDLNEQDEEYILREQQRLANEKKDEKNKKNKKEDKDIFADSDGDDDNEPEEKSEQIKNVYTESSSSHEAILKALEQGDKEASAANTDFN